MINLVDSQQSTVYVVKAQDISDGEYFCKAQGDLQNWNYILLLWLLVGSFQVML